VIDSSMAGLLNSLSIGWVRATFVVLTIRSIDLLFKTVFGSLMLVIFYNRLLREVLQVRRRARRVRRGAWRAWRFSWRFATRRKDNPTVSASATSDAHRQHAIVAGDTAARRANDAGPANTTTHPVSRVRQSTHRRSTD
jgi:hypothetical protein